MYSGLTSLQQECHRNVWIRTSSEECQLTSLLNDIRKCSEQVNCSASLESTVDSRYLEVEGAR